MMKHGLSLKLLFYILVCSSCFTLLVTAFQLYTDYKRDLAAVHESLQFIENGYLKTLATSAYDMDEEQLRLQLQGALKLQDIEYLEIAEHREAGEVIIAAQGNPKSRKDIFREFSLIYSDAPAGTLNTAKLRVIASLEGVYQRLWTKALIILASNAGKTFLASFFIFLIIQFSITRHISKMAKFTHRLDLDTLGQELLLNRKTDQSKPDELDELVIAFNDMRGNLVKGIEKHMKAEKDLRESEEKYRRIFENSVVGFFQSTPEGRFISVNPAFAKMLSYESPEDLLTSISDIAAQYYVNPKDRKHYQEILHQNGRVDGFEFKVQRKDGSEIWVSNSTRAYFDKYGEVVLYEGIVIDITERKRLEDQLRQSQKLESIGTLAGGIAHDFNNILSPIMIHSEMAKMELPPDSPVQHNLREIYKAGERATDMVKQILTFSRKKEAARAVIKIAPVLKEVFKMLRSSIPTTIDIQQNLEAESDTVLADPTQIHQIMLNLGTNAAHAMQEKGGTLKVSLVKEDLDSEAAALYSDLNPASYLKLTVSDTGSGIDAETMQKIFEPYFTTKEIGEGTGMGLALIHGIVKSYGGDITVESELGKGTTFNVYLPSVEADVLPVEDPSVQLHTGAERILFVDDEKSAVDAIQPMLENLGYKVTAGTSSVEALEAFKNDSNGFDLVITDQTMPNMTGKDLAKELMSIRPDIPIILCTGFSEQIDEVTAKEMGISFLMKPIVLSQIANTIRKVLDKK